MGMMKKIVIGMSVAAFAMVVAGNMNIAALKGVTHLYVETASDKAIGKFRSRAVEIPVSYPAAPTSTGSDSVE